MKKCLYLVFVAATFLCGVLQARVVPQGESLWKMQQLVTQASFDVIIRQSDLSGGVYTVSNTGVYSLAENITGKILIGVGGVVLDLNGKTVSNSDDACVQVNGVSRVTIKNGSLVSSNDRGIVVQPGSSRVYVDHVKGYDGTAGMMATNATDITVQSCDFISSDTGVYCDTVSRLFVSDTRVSNAMFIGFFLDGTTKSLFTNCLALNTGLDLSALTVDVYGFISTDGSNNIFKSCTAQNTLALTVTGSTNVAAGFALTGTESNSQVVNCTSDVVQTSASGFATPYGIFLDYSFDALTTLTGASQGAQCFALSWSPDGAYLARGGIQDGVEAIQLFSFNRATGFLTTLTGASQGAQCFALSWSPDGAYLATGGGEVGGDEIQVFSFNSTGLLTKVDEANQGAVDCFALSWSPDGAYLATGGGEVGVDEIQLFSFNRSTGLLTKVDGADQGTLCYALSWSPDGAYLATGGFPEGGDEIQLFSFNRSTGLLTKVDGADQGTLCSALSWSPDGAYLATGGEPEGGDEIQLFSFNRSTGLLTKVDGADQGIRCLAISWSPDGAYLATGGSPEGVDEIQLFSFNRSTGLLTKVDGADQGIRCLAISWSPDGAYLATGGEPQSLSEFQIFSALQFPSNNMILNNNVQSVSRSSSIAGGVGISGSSIENMIVGNRAYNNAAFNYQFVTNVFDERFTAIPTSIENISFKLTPPFYAP